MTDESLNGEADPKVEVDAGAVIDILLNHNEPLVREAAKAAYWQAVAEARTIQVKAALQTAVDVTAYGDTED